jgi:hypothetical protein
MKFLKIKSEDNSDSIINISNVCFFHQLKDNKIQVEFVDGACLIIKGYSIEQFEKSIKEFDNTQNLCVL